MKKIDINTFQSPDFDSVFTARKKYSVALGNGFRKTFGSKAEVTQFLTQTNKDLTNFMLDLNFLYIEVFRIYRTAWIYFDFENPKQKQNLQGTIEEKVSAVDSAFNIMVDRSHWQNGNYLVFSHFNTVINLQKEILIDLHELFKYRGHTAQMYETQNMINRLDFNKTQLKIYPSKMEIVTIDTKPIEVKPEPENADYSLSMLRVV